MRGIAIHRNREIGQDVPQLRPARLKFGKTFREGANFRGTGLHADDGTFHRCGCRETAYHAFHIAAVQRGGVTDEQILDG